MTIRTLPSHLRRYWYLYLPLSAIWTLALVRVLVDHTPRLPVLFNVSPSLPYTVALVDYHKTSFARGDYIVYAFDGPAKAVYPGVKRQPFFKMIRGVAGDRITVRENHVYVNGEHMGFAKSTAPGRVRLEPIAEMVIPAGQFYVQGTGSDSFDSRYALSGLVRAEQILSAVKPLF